MLKKVGYGIFYTLVAIISISAVKYFFLKEFLLNLDVPLLEKLYQSPISLYLHTSCAAVALAIGALQMNQRLRTKYLTAHRFLGRAYVIAVIVSACAGLFMATKSEGGMFAHIGFSLLAVIWGSTVCIAYTRIRHKNIIAHRYWMIISYALTCAGITLRLHQLILAELFNIEDIQVQFLILAWSSWVPNLLIALLYLEKKKAKNHISPTKNVDPLRI